MTAKLNKDGVQGGKLLSVAEYNKIAQEKRKKAKAKANK